ncbi:MAG: hypothetical protein WB902_06180, partial [Acetobacteraceae bacterium]
VDQQVKDLRLDVHRNLSAPNFAPFDIDFAVAKAEGHPRAKNAWDGAQPPAIRGKIITPVCRERLSGSPESKGVSRTYKEILEIKSLLSESLDRPHRACCCRCPRSEEGPHGGTRRCH